MVKKYCIKYNGQSFAGYLDLAYYLIRNKEKFDDNIFPSNDMFLARAALEKKFNRRFKMSEIKNILKDKTWQWRTTSSQALNTMKEESGVSRQVY